MLEIGGVEFERSGVILTSGELQGGDGIYLSLNPMGGDCYLFFVSVGVDGAMWWSTPRGLTTSSRRRWLSCLAESLHSLSDVLYKGLHVFCHGLKSRVSAQDAGFV